MMEPDAVDAGFDGNGRNGGGAICAYDKTHPTLEERDDDGLGDSRDGGSPKSRRNGRSKSKLGTPKDDSGGMDRTSSGGQKLLDAIVGQEPTTPARTPKRNIDDILASGRGTPSESRESLIWKPIVPSPTHSTRLGDLLPRERNPPPPPLPPRPPANDGGPPGSRNLSRYRQLSKEERRRLLHEVKLVLGEESLLSGANNNRSEEEDGNDRSLLYDDSQSMLEEEEDGGDGRSLDETSYQHTLETGLDTGVDMLSFAEDTIYTADTSALDRTMYTTDDRTMYTADTSAFYTENASAFHSEDGRQSSAFLSHHDMQNSAFLSEDDRQNSPSYSEIDRQNYQSDNRTRGKTMSESVLSEIEEEDDSNIFSLADACVSYLCDGNRGETEEEKTARPLRQRQRLRRLVREETKLNSRGGRRRGGRRTRDLEGEEDTTATFVTAEIGELSARVCAIPGLTVKQRLAKLEDELIMRKGKKKAAVFERVHTPTSYDFELLGMRREDSNGVALTEATYVDYDNDNEEHVHGADDESGFWKGNGIWMSDPSIITLSPAPSPSPSPLPDIVSSNNITETNTAAAQLEGYISNGGDGVQITLSHYDRIGFECNEDTAVDKENKISLVNNDKEVVDAPPKNRPSSPSACAKSLNKVRSAKPLTTKSRSVSPFVRAMSSLSQKISKPDMEEANHDLGRSRTPESGLSGKSEPSDGTKSTNDTNPDANSDAEEEVSAKTSMSAISTNAGGGDMDRDKGGIPGSGGSIMRKKAGWKEYVDPNTGNKYYSNGMITTWERPVNAEIVAVSRHGTPMTQTTPLVSNTTSSRKKVVVSASLIRVPPLDSVVTSPLNNKSQQVKKSKAQRKANKFRLFSKFRNKNTSSGDKGKKKEKDAPPSSGVLPSSNPASPDRTVDSDSSPPGTRSQLTPLAKIITTDLPIADVINNVSDIDATGNLKQTNATITTTPKKNKRGWREYTDPGSGKKYYSDGIMTTWVRPTGFTGKSQSPPPVASSSASISASNPPNNVNAQCQKTNKANNTMAAASITVTARMKKKGWREYTDPNTGKSYYSDGVTTTWERPYNF